MAGKNLIAQTMIQSAVIMDILFAPVSSPLAAPLIAGGLILFGIVIRSQMKSDYDTYIQLFKDVLVQLGKTNSNPIKFAREDLDSFDHFINKKQQYETTHTNMLRQKWREFKKHSSINEVQDRSQGIQNSIEPKRVFDPNASGFEPKFSGISYNAIPTYFVSFGLLMTFYSLAALLNDIDPNKQGGVEDALTTASFKFIISIAGLFCSIILSIKYKKLHNELAELIDEFCQKLEVRFIFDRSKDQMVLEAMNRINNSVNARMTELRDLLSVRLKDNEILATLDKVHTSVNNQTAVIVKELKESIGDGFADIRDSMSDIATTIEELGTNISNVAETLNSCDELLRKNVEAAASAFTDAINNFVEAAQQMKGIYEDAAAITKDNFDDMNVSMENFNEKLEDNIAAAQSAFSDATGIFIKGFKELEELLRKIARLEEALNSLPADISSSVSAGMKEFLKEQFLSIEKSLNDIQGHVKSIKEIEQAIKTTAANLAKDATVQNVNQSITKLQEANNATQSRLVDTLGKITPAGKLRARKDTKAASAKSREPAKQPQDKRYPGDQLK